MSYLIRDIVSRARSLTQDTEPEYRYEDGLYIGYINDAMFEARRIRPDLFIGSSGQVGFITMDNVDDPISIDAQYFTAIVDYVAGMVGLEDDKFLPDGKPSKLLATFHVKLTGKL